MPATFRAEVRKIRGLLTQGEFAQSLGVGRVTVACWESGKHAPSLRHARKLVQRGMDPAVAFAAVSERDGTTAA